MTYDEMPDEYDPDLIEVLPRAELNAVVDGLLRTHRPDRSAPNADWYDEVAAKIEGKITVTEAKRLAARQMIAIREGVATKRVNKFLKTLATDGGFEMTEAWAPFADDPVAFIEGGDSEDPGQRVRVALRAMRSVDWRQFARHGRADAQHRFSAEMAMYDAADWLASQQGSDLFADWASGIHPVQKDIAS